jgi:hypothetical protein
MERNCWLKDKNVSMRPSGYRVPNESGNSAVNRKSAGNNIKYLLCALTFPTESKISLDRNVWIADTGASVHIQAHRKGLENVRAATAAETITMGNGSAELTAPIGNLPVEQQFVTSTATN